MERFENGSDMSKRVLDLLEPVKLIVWKVVIERVTVIKFRMDNIGDNGAGCFEVEIWADTAKFTNVIVVGCRKCRDLVGECKESVINVVLSAVSPIVRSFARLFGCYCA